MTDEQIERKIQHVEDLMDLKIRMQNCRIDLIAEESRYCHTANRVFVLVMIVFIAFAAISVASNKKEPKTTTELEQVK